MWRQPATSEVHPTSQRSATTRSPSPTRPGQPNRMEWRAGLRQRHPRSRRCRQRDGHIRGGRCVKLARSVPGMLRRRGRQRHRRRSVPPRRHSPGNYTCQHAYRISHGECSPCSWASRTRRPAHLRPAAAVSGQIADRLRCDPPYRFALSHRSWKRRDVAREIGRGGTCHALYRYAHEGNRALRHLFHGLLGDRLRGGFNHFLHKFLNQHIFDGVQATVGLLFLSHIARGRHLQDPEGIRSIARILWRETVAKPDRVHGLDAYKIANSMLRTGPAVALAPRIRAFRAEILAKSSANLSQRANSARCSSRTSAT